MVPNELGGMELGVIELGPDMGTDVDMGAENPLVILAAGALYCDEAIMLGWWAVSI